MEELRHCDRIAAKVHLAIGVVAILGLPLLSIAAGAHGLAFTMFSGSGSFRLRIVAIDQTGIERRVPPTAVAAHARGSIGDVLAGTEGWRFAPFGALVRRQLDQVAALACDTVTSSRRVTVALEERSTLDAPVRTSRVDRTCR